MTQAQPRRIVLAARPQGMPVDADFRLETFDMPAPRDGQVLLKTRYLSVDPYMRGRMDDRKSYVPPVAIDAVMGGGGIGEVLASRHPDFQAGDLAVGTTGWQTHSVVEGAMLRKIDPALAPLTTALGVLGMPGFTAWSGLKFIGQPKAGETVVVSAASGAVGSLVGQLARKAGARAVGIAGGARKCAFLRDELGFDAAIDHHAADFAQQLADACPKGVDVYFENVGGAVWQAILPLMNKHGRVPLCGLIALYNGVPDTAQDDRLSATMRAILTNSLTIRGFLVSEFNAHLAEFLQETAPDVSAGRIRYREDIVDGLAQAPRALMGMLAGQNFGKLLIRVDA
ncbi:MAG: NADP-dependent oxidoreductase [Janthinobacterium lividum]